MPNVIMNKGGIGISLTRKETAARVNTILQKQVLLNKAYEALAIGLTGQEKREKLAGLQRTARVNVAKLSETILSAGGTPYSGVDLPDAPSEDGTTSFENAVRMEQDLADAVATELKEDHQIRTQAILKIVQKDSKERLDFLKSLSR